jgi:ribosomal protein S18 acetylase RimI-like enzyme
MAPKKAEYYTKQLTKRTLPDFEKLFETHPAPGAFPCWCMYNHRPHASPESLRLHSGVERAARNREEKRKLVENNASRGILVYRSGEPVGWCQYGSKEELPRIDSNPAYRLLAQKIGSEKLWRITCFVVNRRYRRRGVASIALKAAVDAIRKQGGGLAEAYPIAHWGAYQDYRGTVSMFKKQGFKTIAPLGKNNVLVRRTI